MSSSVEYSKMCLVNSHFLDFLWNFLWIMEFIKASSLGMIFILIRVLTTSLYFCNKFWYAVFFEWCEALSEKKTSLKPDYYCSEYSSSTNTC